MKPSYPPLAQEKICLVEETEALRLLVDKARAGTDVVIARHGRPMARLSPIALAGPQGAAAETTPDPWDMIRDAGKDLSEEFFEAMEKRERRLPVERLPLDPSEDNQRAV